MVRTDSKLKFAVCGGGTGGHIFPALAVVDALKKNCPNDEVVYFGKQDGMEAAIVKEKNIPFYGLDVAGLKRSLTLKNIGTIWKAGTAYRKARKLLRQLNIKSILGTGGFVCGPVMAAASSLKIPTVIHESNAVPGLTNRMLGGMVRKIALSHVATKRYFDERKVVHTGFPLRQELDRATREQGCRHFGLDPSRRVLFVFPGSLAARRINRAVSELLPDLVKQLPDVQLLWMTGKADHHMAKQGCADLDINVSIHEFIQDVPEALAAADLVLARAGAGTIAELSATGKATLLVPYPHATGNHQQLNAEVLQRAGMADVLLDKDVTGQTLLDQLVLDFKKLENMTACAEVWKATYPKEAAEELARLMVAMSDQLTCS